MIAPHVPVHLGSMQYAVLWQHEHWKGKLKEGDVLVSNHPSTLSSVYINPGTVASILGISRSVEELIFLTSPVIYPIFQLVEKLSSMWHRV